MIVVLRHVDAHHKTCGYYPSLEWGTSGVTATGLGARTPGFCPHSAVLEGKKGAGKSKGGKDAQQQRHAPL